MSARSSVIVFDTETTGLIANSAVPLKNQPQIIELFAIKLDAETLEEVDTWHSLFWVKEVSAEVTGITSITTDMLKDAPKFAAMLDSLSDFFLGTKHLVGHNLSFDIDQLHMELRRMAADKAFPWPPSHLCTVEATEGLEGYRLALAVLHERVTGSGFDGAHRAESDVRATADVLRKLVADGTVKL